MKDIFSKLALGAIALLALGATGCDNIDENDRLKPYERPESTKMVVLWKFTGQRCIYCPGGDVVINEIHSANPDNFIAVGLHPENDNFTRPLHGLDLTCPAATAYKEYYKPQTFPYAIIDGNSNMQGSVPTEWRKFVSECLKDPKTGLSIYPEANIALQTKYTTKTEDDGKEIQTVTIDYSVLFKEAVTQACNIQLWIIENGIVGSQLMSDGKPNKEYVHNHVLRAAVNGNWGEEIGKDFQPTAAAAGTATYTLKDDWKAENCQVVAFIFNASSKKIYQGAICNVINDTNQKD